MRTPDPSSILDPAIAELELILRSLRRARKSMRLAELMVIKHASPAWKASIQAGIEAAWAADRPALTERLRENGRKARKLPEMSKTEVLLYNKLRRVLPRDVAVRAALAAHQP